MQARSLLKTGLLTVFYLGGVAVVFAVFLFGAYVVWEAGTGLHRPLPSPGGASTATLRVHGVRDGHDVSVDLRPRFALFRHTVYHALDKGDGSSETAASHVSLRWRGPNELTITCKGCEGFRILENESAWRAVRITLIAAP